MAPPKWATVEEETFLQAHSARYQICQAKRNYTRFWEPVFEEWFGKFPEQLRVYKDIPLDVELTDEQKTVVGKAVENRRQQIMNKFKNDMGSSKVNCRNKNRNNRMMTADVTTASTSTTVTSKKSMVAQMMSNTRPVRGPQVTEAFSKLFFDDMIKPTLDLAFETAKAEAEAKAAAEKTEVKIPSKLSVIRKHTTLLYNSASDDVKQQVAEFIEEAKQKKKKELQEAKGAGVVDHQVLPGALTEFFNELQRLTGYVVTVLMGGPTPAMGGQIDIQSFHVGATEVGNQFDQAYPEFNSGIMRPWKEFVKRVFHKSDLRAVAAVKEEGSIWGASRHSTLEPELLKDVDSANDVSEMVTDIDGAFEKFPRDISMVSSALFPHESEPLRSSSSQSPSSTMPPLCPLHSASPMRLDSDAVSSMHLGSDAVSSMLAAEGFYEFLSTYGTQEIPPMQSLLPPTHGPIPPSTSLMPKPLSISEVASSANDDIAPQQASHLPVCQVNMPSQSDIQGMQSSSMITDLITKAPSVPVESHPQAPSIPVESHLQAPSIPVESHSVPVESHPQAPSQSTSMESVSTSTEPAPMSTSAEPAPASTSAEPAPASTSAEPAPMSTSTSAEPTPSSEVIVSPIVGRGK
ncbi:hypothetical protein F4604DRAFT_1917093 [Suillus subluteus]|nr:hypothetical protein F4604DRAFT_1917093 [Suillus subluteus]